MILSVKRVSSAATSGASRLSSLSKGVSQKGPRFQDILQAHSVEKNQAVQVPTDPFQAMKSLSNRVMGNDKLSSKELLLYQIRAGEFGMQVELVSKVAESMSASMRKLQNQG